MKSLLLSLLIAAAAATTLSCNSKPANHDTAGLNSRADDSTQVVSLLKDMYRWHDGNQAGGADFSIIVKDTAQVGLNYDSLTRTMGVLRQTNFFSRSFLDNYKALADFINRKLVKANPPLANEINFDFQDADPWTGFQDSDSAYWNKFQITAYRSTADSASLKWLIKTKDWSSDPYAVGFAKENGQWKVSSLEGFDLKKYNK
jgi:hypothetical protein